MKFLLAIILITNAFAGEKIDHILAKVQNQRAQIVIFDLDDTLFSSSSRTKIIFKEFLENSQVLNTYPNESKKLNMIQEDQIQYSIEETIKNAGINNKNFTRNLLKFWKQRFFENKYVKKDSPILGGKEFVNKLFKKGAQILYLTGRDHSMREGTIESLKDSGFPINNKNAILITKPKFETPDLEYKKEAFQMISQMGHVIAFFENEPKNLNALIDFFGNDTDAVFLNTKHSPSDVTPYENTTSIKNYLD